MGLSRSRQRLEPQVWVSAGSQNQSPAGGEGQLSSGGVKRYTRFVFVIWAEHLLLAAMGFRLAGDSAPRRPDSSHCEDGSQGRQAIGRPSPRHLGSLLAPRCWGSREHAGGSVLVTGWGVNRRVGGLRLFLAQNHKIRDRRQTEGHGLSGKSSAALRSPLPRDMGTSVSVSFKYRPLHFYFSAFDVCKASEVNSFKPMACGLHLNLEEAF